MENTTIVKNVTGATNENGDISVQLFNDLYKMFYSGLLPVTILIGIPGNLLTLVMLRGLNEWNATTMNIVSLTVADFLNLVCNSVIVVQQNLIIYLPDIGFEMFRIVSPYYTSWLAKMFARYSMVFTVFIALERVFAVLFPLHAKNMWTKTVSTIVAVSTLIVVLGYYLPNAFRYEIKQTYDNTTGETNRFLGLTYFGQNSDFWQPYDNVEVFGFQITPLFLTACLNTVIIIVLFVNKQRRMKLSSSLEKSGSEKSKSKEMRATRTVLGVTIAFTFCMMPSSIVQLILIADPTSGQHTYGTLRIRILYVMAYELYMFNSTINFVIYIISSKVYRSQYIKVIRRICCCKVADIPSIRTVETSNRQS